MSRQDTISPTPEVDPQPQRPGRRGVVLAGIATGVALVLVMAGLIMWRLDSGRHPGSASATSTVKPSWGRTPVSRDGMAGRVGVRVTRVAVSGGGGLIDLRYQVVDADLANALHDPANPPALVDEATGLVVRNLLMDHAHTGPFKTGVTYPLLFENPGNWVHTGGKVTVLLGNAEVQHVVVQ